MPMHSDDRGELKECGAMTNIRSVVGSVAWTTIVLGLLAFGAAVLTALLGSNYAILFIFAGVALAGTGVVLLITLSKDPAPTGLASERPSYAGKPFTLTFTVGERETHTVTFAFDQLWGWLTIAVDDVLIVKKLVLLSFRLVAVYEFIVGAAEVHTVRIEKRRALYKSYRKPQPIRAFVDGTMVAETDGRRRA
jgi:hypothetical protein